MRQIKLMRKWFSALAALCLCASLFSARAQENSSAPAASKAISAQDVAKNLSLITGVAISPLLGVSAVGAYQYFEAKTPERRAKLDWYAKPEFFITALIIVGLCFIKDTAGS